MKVIGIDSGVHTGFAIFCKKEKRIVYAKELLLHQAWFKVLDLHKQGDVFVYVEDARLARYGRKDKASIAKAQGAGSVKRDAKAWEDFLKDMEIPYKMVRPNKRIAKLDANTVKMHTGWGERTNKDVRDAIMIAFTYERLQKVQ